MILGVSKFLLLYILHFCPTLQVSWGLVCPWSWARVPVAAARLEISCLQDRTVYCTVPDLISHGSEKATEDGDRHRITDDRGMQAGY